MLKYFKDKATDIANGISFPNQEGLSQGKLGDIMRKYTDKILKDMKPQGPSRDLKQATITFKRRKLLS